MIWYAPSHLLTSYVYFRYFSCQKDYIALSRSPFESYSFHSSSSLKGGDKCRDVKREGNEILTQRSPHEKSFFFPLSQFTGLPAASITIQKIVKTIG